MSGSVVVEPGHPTLDEAALTLLRQRLRSTRLLAQDGTGWERGVPGQWLAELLTGWQAFDTALFQSRLDRLDHLLINVGGQAVHVVRALGVGPDPMPLLLTHGWPGSFCEYLPMLPLLIDPASDGGDPADAFTVVVPSLPGFGFSGPPTTPGLGATAVAELWHRLMTEGLGHSHFAAHGSDLGAGITARLARAHPESVLGIHLATPELPPPPRPWTEAEESYFAQREKWSAQEGGYEHEQATKPATLGAALHDSPAGLAAWIGEKVEAWSSTTPDGHTAFDRSLLLDTLTLYWATGTIASSLLPYWAYARSGDGALPAGDAVAVPTAISVFGGERVPFPKPHRALAERYFTVSAWREYECGGHFPAVAEPALLAQILRDTFRPLRRAR